MSGKADMIFGDFTDYWMLGDGRDVMAKVKVAIQANDRKLGAMVRALAFEVGNTGAVKGSSWTQMLLRGHLEFNFATDQKAEQFRQALTTYLPAKFAHVVE